MTTRPAYCLSTPSVTLAYIFFEGTTASAKSCTRPSSKPYGAQDRDTISLLLVSDNTRNSKGQNQKCNRRRKMQSHKEQRDGEFLTKEGQVPTTTSNSSQVITLNADDILLSLVRDLYQHHFNKLNGSNVLHHCRPRTLVDF